MEQFSTVEDVAKHFQVSVATVRAWVRKGSIPESTYAHFGNTYRFKLSAVVDAVMGARSADVEAPEIDEELWVDYTEQV
jgi:excisionase family DNA binding protein|tara:strand:- start:1173 stop:1409 length:237 start_codon:yes stop_codon:yes gene_type:complete